MSQYAGDLPVAVMPELRQEGPHLWVRPCQEVLDQDRTITGEVGSQTLSNYPEVPRKALGVRRLRPGGDLLGQVSDDPSWALPSTVDRGPMHPGSVCDDPDAHPDGTLLHEQRSRRRKNGLPVLCGAPAGAPTAGGEGVAHVIHMGHTNATNCCFRMADMWRPSSLQARGSQAARSGSIDLSAAVHARASTDLPVSAETAWDVLADVEAWPRFLPGVSRARIMMSGDTPRDPRLGQGAEFRWTNAGVPLRSCVEVVETGRELTWTGVALWLVAVHRNTLEPLSADSCRLTSQESMAGLGASWLMPADKLGRELTGFVQAIRDEAVRRCV